MSGSLLSRAITSDLSQPQTQVDQMVEGFLRQVSDWRSLAAMTAGGMASRLGKVGALSSGLGRIASTSLALGAEVSAFEISNRGLQNGGSSLWKWEGRGGLKQGLLSSLVTFGTLKGFGRLAQGQNIVLQHGAQDAAMVLGHQFVYRAGLGPRPEGTLAEQFVHAEAMNWQMSGGMALVHGLSPQLAAAERSMNLFLQPERDSSSPETALSDRLFGERALAAEGIPGVFYSKSLEAKDAKSSSVLAMSSLGKGEGGGLRRKDYPHVHEKVIEKNGTSLTVKVFSREPIPEVDRAVLELTESFLGLPDSSEGKASSLKGPIAAMLKSDPDLHRFFQNPLKKFEIQFDWEGREILGLRISKDDVRVDLSVSQASFTSLPSAERPSGQPTVGVLGRSIKKKSKK